VPDRDHGYIMEAVRAIARPLYGEHELDDIAELIAHKRIVMLGEASHGTHEFYDLRAALTRRLIARHGFAAVAVDGDWPDVLRIDHYVRSGGEEETAEDALAAFERFPRWMWRNEEVVAFVEWLHTYNRGRPGGERAGCYGLDLYSLHSSSHVALAVLEDVDPDAVACARQRYACFDHAAGAPELYGLQAQLGISPRCETEVVAQLVEMQRRKIARGGRAPSGDAWFHAVQQARVVRDAEAYYRAMFGARDAAWNLRETHMADTLDMLAHELGSADAPAKLVVWAHNAHAGDARATELGEAGQLTLGQLARQRHPSEVALVGFTTYAGSVIAASDWDEPAEREHVREALDGSWEALLHDVDEPRCYVTAAALRDALGNRERRLERGIGVIYRPDRERASHYYHARLAEQFDLVIHVDATRGVQPLDALDVREPPPAALEQAETFPTGV